MIIQSSPLFVLLGNMLLLTVFFFLCTGVVFLLHRYCTRRKSGNVRYRPYALCTAAFSLFIFVVLLCGFHWGRFRYEVRPWQYVDERVPKGFDGYRIAVISDMHIEGFSDRPEWVDTLVDAVNAQHPDVIFFTGDLVSFDHLGAVPYLSALRRLQAPDGVISIMGNHDYSVYSFALDSLQQKNDCVLLEDFQRNRLHWQLLTNEHTVLHRNGDSIAVLGLENQSCGLHQKVRRGNLAQTMDGTEGMFRILLSHDPSQWDAEVLGKTDIPLTVSGHTHAMQIRFWGWSPCRWVMKRSDGLYQEGRQRLYVNIGLGTLLPARLGATPEITLITLSRK